MLVKVFALAGFVVGVGTAMALAESGGPAELPPADYQGQSYVDSQGCIFLKAGYDGEASWVPRVGQDRKTICGQTPTQTVVKVASASGENVVTPVRKARVAKPAAIAGVPPLPVTIGCPVSVPVARRYATTDGGSVVLCTATNGSLTGARSPIYPKGSGVGAALKSARQNGITIPLGNQVAAAPQATAVMVLPKGYEMAWKDGRLNPHRGKGTAAGQAAQDKIWSREVPAVAIAANAKRAPSVQTSVSTSNGQAATAIYIQVGAFGKPSNADGAAKRLAALGLPVTRGKTSSSLQVVYAGPFASASDAASALNAARRNGFSDAFIR